MPIDNKNFEQTILAMYGDNGRAWLSALPSIIAELACMWHITDLQPVAAMSYNYVMTGTANDTPVILKIGNSITFGDCAMQREAEALIALAGPCVKVVARNDHLGGLLLERLLPGTMLSSFFPERDQEGIIITSNLIKAFEHPETKSPSFQSVEDIFMILDKEWDAVSRHLVKARALRTTLLATTAKNSVLHGDLHHENILLHGDTWRVIDPKGFIGDPAYECGAYIRNPFPELVAHSDAISIIKNRINLFAELLNLDKKRIAHWAYVQAVLAACWAIEDNLDPRLWISLCDLLEHAL